MTRQEAKNLFSNPAALFALSAILVTMIALFGFETKAAHSEDIRTVEAKQTDIHADQEKAHAQEFARVVCLLQEIKTPSGKLCP